jgi:hypothetical protein
VDRLLERLLDRPDLGESAREPEEDMRHLGVLPHLLQHVLERGGAIGSVIGGTLQGGHRGSL